MRNKTRLTRILRSIGKEFSSTNRTQRMFGKPRVSTLQMKSMITTWNHTCGLFLAYVVKTNGAFRSSNKMFTGDSGYVLELRR